MSPWDNHSFDPSLHRIILKIVGFETDLLRCKLHNPQFFQGTQQKLRQFVVVSWSDLGNGFFSLSLGIPIVLTIAVKALQVPCSNTYLVAVYLLLIRVPVFEKFLA